MNKKLIKEVGHISSWPGGGFFGFIATARPNRKLYWANKRDHFLPGFDETKLKKGTPVEFSYDPDEVPVGDDLPKAWDIRMREQ